jgi:hypothetical protein
MMGQVGAGQCEYDVINVDDVLTLDIPWFVSGGVGSTLPYGSLLLIPA